jgi:hypothetical protein
MTRDEARQILELGGCVTYRAWTWGKCWKSCWDEYNCCADDFESVEATLDNIEWFCNGDWGLLEEES